MASALLNTLSKENKLTWFISILILLLPPLLIFMASQDSNFGLGSVIYIFLILPLYTAITGVVFFILYVILRRFFAPIKSYHVALFISVPLLIWILFFIDEGIILTALFTKNMDLCGRIHSSHFYDKCLLKFVVAGENDENVCGKIRDGFSRERCFSIISGRKRDCDRCGNFNSVRCGGFVDLDRTGKKVVMQAAFGETLRIIYAARDKETFAKVHDWFSRQMNSDLALINHFKRYDRVFTVSLGTMAAVVPGEAPYLDGIIVRFLDKEHKGEKAWVLSCDTRDIIGDSRSVTQAVRFSAGDLNKDLLITPDSIFPVTVIQSGNTERPSSCGDGACGPGESLETCPEECGYNIYPYAADADSCRDSTGRNYPTTGKGASRWFGYGGCGYVKYYKVYAGKPLIFYVFTDSCPGCGCHYPDFTVSEFIGGVWIPSVKFDLPEVAGLRKAVVYTPRSAQIKVEARNCFYLDVYTGTPVE